ncbi:MAG: metal-dependent hydrolase, partial [Litorimonas sp.]
MTAPSQSPLTVRRVSFDFAGIPFHWHPSPALSAIGNATSFGAVAFERMVCQSVKEALPLIRDPALEAECRDFIAQEAMHSAAHKRHVKALLEVQPDLAGVPGQVEALNAELFGDRPLHARLGFAALLEGVLPALGRHMIVERKTLFDGADPRMSALLLWHFCEEIEHEATAAKLYRHLYPKRWRVRDVPLTLRFFARFTALMER